MTSFGISLRRKERKGEKDKREGGEIVNQNHLSVSFCYVKLGHNVIEHVVGL